MSFQLSAETAGRKPNPRALPAKGRERSLPAGQGQDLLVLADAVERDEHRLDAVVSGVDPGVVEVLGWRRVSQCLSRKI